MLNGRTAAAVAAAAIWFMPAEAADTRGLNFAQTLELHLTAIQTRDLDLLRRTLTAGPDLELFLPDGRRLTTRQAFEALHVAWFADRSWTWHYTPIARIETTDLAVATVKTRSEVRQPDGRVSAWSENWLTLTFRREPGGWALVHDQNTPVGRAP